MLKIRKPVIRKKKYYLLLGKKSGFLYGAFPRSKEGKEMARDYRGTLVNKKDKEFVIK